MTKRLSVLIVVLVAIGALLMGCGVKEKTAQTTETGRRTAFTMGTVANITVHGVGAEEAVDAVVEEMERLTTAVDRFAPGSDVYRVNTSAGAWVKVAEETLELVEEALELAELTDGAFDPSVAPLIDLWGFVEDPYATADENDSPTVLRGQRPPDDAAIQETLQHVGYELIEVDRENSSIRMGSSRAQVDLGGIAKGYAADRAVAILKERGIESALVDLGGDMYAVGTKPDGSEWRVGVIDPRDSSSVIAAIPLSDRAVVTSGDYERYFIYEGVRYTHLVDPRVGYPQHELASVTVIAPSGTQADALATAVSILGMEKGLALLESLPNVDGILISTDGQIEITSDIKDKVQLRSGGS